MSRYPAIIRIILLWKHLKLKLFFVYVNWFYILLDKCQNKNRLSKQVRLHIKRFKKTYGVLCNSKKALRYDGHSCNLRWQIKTYGKVTPMLSRVAKTLWLCEKAGINAEFCTSSDEFQTLFDIPKQSSLSEEILPIRFVSVGKSIPSEIAYKLSEKLPVNKELRNKADEWFNKHIKGDWVAVHYRGTDVVSSHRYKIELEPYVTYLKAVLDDKCSIFACSDQVQFIDKMQVVFSGRVFARDIQRSSNREALHLSPKHKGIQQQQDALIDMLILAKADLIYTTGSGFVAVVRFFNPKTKIISLNECKLRGGCYIPIPQKDVFDKLKIK